MFYEIISGEKFLQNYEFKFDYKIINYYSLRKRYDFEQSVFDNFVKFFVEDSININNINKNFEELVKFLEFDIDDAKPLERYSTGQISKIIYSLPLFLNYDVYILSEIPLDADLTFENKVIEIIENLSKSKIFSLILNLKIKIIISLPNILISTIWKIFIVNQQINIKKMLVIYLLKKMIK